MKRRVARFDDLSDASADHDLADFDGRRIAARRVHAPAHVGINGKIERAHQHFPIAKSWKGRFDQAEVGFTNHAPGAGRENKLTIDHKRLTKVEN